ncbi:MAG: cysteine--tRNA ligase [bacterium]
MRIFNSLSRKVEEVVPIVPGKIGMYTCGPTVYSTATIGNFRTYMLCDWLNRSLRYLGYEVKSVMNLTDVGHLTGDNEGDSSQGEDRLEKASRKESKTAWEIAKNYGNEFVEHLQIYNIIKPDVLCKATEHIAEQIAMIEKLEAKSLTYKIADGIYFDTVAYEAMGFEYGELSNLDEIKKGARLEPNPEKKNPRDFALWKLSPKDGTRRQMEWESPWGVGFPGWHIECSAMSTKYLGEQFDIHVGGEDLKSTHHPNEIAQSEGATGKKPFVKNWVHGAFILIDGGRMGKSLGNAYTVTDLVEKKIDPLALRYFYLTGHYRRQLNFTWEGLSSAASALTKLRGIYQASIGEKERTVLSPEKMDKVQLLQTKFRERIEDDLDLPGALAVTWEVAKSNIPGRDKAELLVEFDQVMGLNLMANGQWPMVKDLPEQVEKLIEQREAVRKMRNYAEADKIRLDIEKLGYRLEDKGGRTRAIKND